MAGSSCALKPERAILRAKQDGGVIYSLPANPCSLHAASRRRIFKFSPQCMPKVPGGYAMRLLSHGLLIGSLTTLLALGFLPAATSAQSQSGDSVADAARRAREQKKSAPKPVRTLTDDDLPPKFVPVPAAAPATAGTTEPAKPGQTKPGENPAETSPAVADSKDEAAKKRAEKEEALKQLKAQLAQAQGELDVLQRKATLDSDSYYSQTNYAQDAAGKARLQDDTQQINDKKTQVEELNARIAKLQAELGEKPEPDQSAPPS